MDEYLVMVCMEEEVCVGGYHVSVCVYVYMFICMCLRTCVRVHAAVGMLATKSTKTLS